MATVPASAPSQVTVTGSTVASACFCSSTPIAYRPAAARARTTPHGSTWPVRDAEAMITTPAKATSSPIIS